MLTLLGVVLFLMEKVPGLDDPILKPYYGVEPVVSGIPGALLGVWQRYDVVHFIRIAQSGYSSPDLVPFFPLYPLSSGFIGDLFGGDYLLGGMLVSNLACLLALCVFYAWMQSEWQDEQLTRRSMLFLVWFPTSFFLFVPYSESMFLLFAISSIYAARRGKWLTAGVMGALASLTRVSGIILAAIILAEWAVKKYKDPLQNTVLPILSSLLPPIMYISLALWRSLSGLPGLLEVQESNWFRVPAWPLQGIVEAVWNILGGFVTAIELMDLIVVLFMLLIGILVIKRLKPGLIVYHWGLLLLTLSQTRIGQPLFSQARFALILFPAYILLAQIAGKRFLGRVLLFVFLILNLLLARWFVMGIWVG
jgi:Gpi18-like mannosyltransferase